MPTLRVLRVRCWRRPPPACCSGSGCSSRSSRFDDPLSTVVLDRDGELIGASIAADGQWRFGVAPEVPEKFAQAILRFEDRRFYLHPGVDPLALARARAPEPARAARGERRQHAHDAGGAPRAQGTAPHARGKDGRGRARAAPHAVALEAAGASGSTPPTRRSAATPSGSTPRPGATSAASASRLSWAETATLAVLPNAPALVHPGRNRDRLLAKRDRLLDPLRERGAIDAATAALAKREPLPPLPEPLPMLAPHLLARVSAERRARRFRTGDPSPWVVTTLRKSVQQRAVEILARHRRTLAENGVRNAAALVLDVAERRGARLRREPVAARRRRARRARRRDPRAPQHRQRAEAAALRLDARGRRGAAAAAGPRRADPPRQLPSRELRPRATPARCRRPRRSRARSTCPPFGCCAATASSASAAELRRLGLTTLDRARLRVRPRADPRRRRGLALGRDRGLRRPRARRARTGARSLLRAELPASAARIGASERPAASPLGPAASYLTLRAMLEVERPGDDLAWRAFASSRRVAWKTGTSYGFRDAWAVGVTPRARGRRLGRQRLGRGPARAHRPLGGRADPVRSRRHAAGGGAWFAEPGERASRTSTSARAAACAPAPTARAGAASSCRAPGSTRRRAPTAG